MERRLYLARKQFERAHAQGDVTGYICSLSSQTIVYKAMCKGEFSAGFLSGFGIGRLCDTVRGFSSALCDEHFAHVASRAAGKKTWT